MITVTHREPDGVVITQTWPNHWGMRTEHDGTVIYVHGRGGRGTEQTLASVNSEWFVAAVEPQDDLMALADAVQGERDAEAGADILPFIGDGHPGFIEPSPAGPINIGEHRTGLGPEVQRQVHTLLGGLAAKAKERREADEQLG